MYFEPAKKNYYRFPSQSSTKDFNEKYYYPDKPYASGEHSHDQSTRPMMKASQRID